MLAGAVYDPVALIDPVCVFNDHVTLVLLAPDTVAVNCWVCPAVRVAVLGVTALIETVGFSEIVAVAVFVPSATLVAFTVIVCCAVMLAGAVYSPAVVMAPAPPVFIDQVTAMLLAFATDAVNCCVCEAVKAAVAGVTLTATGGNSVIVAVADFVLSAWLVAVRVTNCCVVIVAGAV